MNRVAAAIAELQRMFPQPAHPALALANFRGMVFGSIVIGLLLWLLESLWPEDREQKKWRRDSHIDVFYWFFGYVVARPLATLAGAAVAILLILFKVPHGDTMLTRQPGWMQWIEAALVGDFLFYWAHRLMHHVPALWRVHAVHHSSKKLDWLASARVHPLEGVFTRVVSTAPLFVLGFRPHVTAFVSLLLAVYPIFIHCNLSWNYGWLGYVFASPAWHRWHHTSEEVALDKNFSGMFPLWDYVFGTAYFPLDRRPTSYGLFKEEVPTSIAGQLVYPFRRS